jgi:hypothetical protein
MGLCPDLRPWRQVGVWVLIELRVFWRRIRFSLASHERESNKSIFRIKGQVFSPVQSQIFISEHDVFGGTPGEEMLNAEG